MNEQLLLLKGMLSELPPEDQLKVSEAKAAIQKIVDDAGGGDTVKPCGLFAVMLVAMQEQETSRSK